MIKTINLAGSEMKVTELGGDNTEIFNNSTGTVYASKLPNIKVGGDNVIAIPAGAIDGLYGTRGTVYLLGTGSIELRGVDHKITETRSQSISGSIGVVQDYIDSKDAATLAAAKNYTDTITSELAGYIGYTDKDIYGLEADFENCKFTRLAGAVGKEAGSDFDNVRAYGGRRRCNLSDSGEVLAYYGDENFKADGSNGQVMVEQPKFYYRVVPLETEKIDGTDGYHLRKARYYISDTPKAGFKVHPAFVRNGIEVDKIYLSAFEGSIYDTSAGTYLLEDEQVAEFNADMLSSIADAKPCSGTSQALTRTNARKLAHNRGVGWEQYTIQSVSATQLLFVIEYATFNSQNAVGIGATLKSDDGVSNMAETTGDTLALGNKSGICKKSNNIQFTSYRGEENLWGNIGKWIDGINVNNPVTWSTAQNPGNQCGTIYVADCNFADNSYNYPYYNIGIPSAYGSGYTSAFGYSYMFDWLFIPSEFSGNSLIPVGDSFWNKNNVGRALFFHNAWNENYRSGLFSFGFNYMPSSKVRLIGARLCFFPKK